MFFRFLPAGRALCTWPADPKITLRFLRLYLYLCVPTYHVFNDYIMHIVTMRPYFS